MPEQLCPNCEGSGMRIVERPDGSRFAQSCECRTVRRAARLLEQARIPQRYKHCILNEYVTNFKGANRSLSTALIHASSFIKAYPLETKGRGLLFTGPIGVGKTHLAVGILRELITERGAKGIFFDYRELLKEVQNSYNRNVDTTELEIMKPVLDADVLVLDELGAAKPTDWVGDTISRVLNSRYNDCRTTIITTNYPNLPPMGPGVSGPKAALREETLGDRIGERMRSRLQEMCVEVPMLGNDFRQMVKRASFL